MQIVYDDDGLDAAMAELSGMGSLGREGGLSAERPALIDRFLEDAVEVDVDAIRDATGEVRGRRDDGAHRGGRRALRRLGVRDPAADARRGDDRDHRGVTRALADALDVRGLLNVQYAVKDGEVFVIEANPRASRTVPFVSKATGRAAGEGRRAGDGRRHAGGAAARGSCARRAPTATSRSRRRSSRSTASPTSTRSSGPRCARRAR